MCESNGLPHWCQRRVGGKNAFSGLILIFLHDVIQDLQRSCLRSTARSVSALNNVSSQSPKPLGAVNSSSICFCYGVEGLLERPLEVLRIDVADLEQWPRPFSPSTSSLPPAIASSFWEPALRAPSSDARLTDSVKASTTTR